MQIGWHYALDIIWILQQLESAGIRPGARILDAGGGLGVLQFVLAARGYEVLSVDVSARRLPLLPRLLYEMQISNASVGTQSPYVAHLSAIHRVQAHRPLRLIGRALRAAPHFLLAYARRVSARRRSGRVTFLQADLTDLAPIPAASFDAVVSLSVIEHIPRDRIAQAVSEMRRVAKPGGVVCVTTSAAHDGDWYHEPSKGWCFGEASLRSLFALGDVASNWLEFETVQRSLLEDSELPRRLPDYYRLTGDCGMPWGVWNPTYVPVGIFFQVSEA